MQQISTNMGGYQWWDQDSNGETKTKSKTLGRKTKTKTVAFRTKTVQDSKVTNIQDPQENTNVCIYRSHN